MRVLIADDDYGMRLVLKKALTDIEDIELAGEAKDGKEALKLYEEHHPDLVFLDVEMPEISGIDCAKEILDTNPKTIIIFVTAHSEYMPEAFELYAFDYLVKPFKLERLHQTLQRIKSIGLQSEEHPLSKKLNPGLNLEKLLVRHKEGIDFVDINEIIIIQRENRATVIYTSKGSYTSSDSLGELEEKLGKGKFFRCHKSYIINLTLIDKIYPYGRWTYVVKLKNTDKDALLTHEKFLELEKLFSI
ncbi:MAG: response regulator of the LytR/AlgR family [Clostridia bacterium]|jgi:two-component system LytT family response regulator|nr:response regulator of the LytR/AlgR family [Clostridia bacterium]